MYGFKKVYTHCVVRLGVVGGVPIDANNVLLTNVSCQSVRKECVED